MASIQEAFRRWCVVRTLVSQFVASEKIYRTSTHWTSDPSTSNIGVEKRPLRLSMDLSG